MSLTNSPQLKIAAKEELVAKWIEPQIESQHAEQTSPILLISGSVLLSVLLIIVGVWQKDFTFYLAAAVALTAGITFYVQQRTPSRQLEIAITTLRLVVGEKS